MLTRFSVSLEKRLLEKFDRHIQRRHYPTRSKAIGDLIREELVREEWLEGGEVAGVITLVYNPHKRELLNKLTELQHSFHSLIISSQHVHLDEDNCLEIIIVRGETKKVEILSNKLKAIKGIKHSSLTMTTTGEKI
jgi:CopG family nickel-responsive transcriptional regulator